MFNCLLFRHFKAELPQHLLMNIAMFDMRDVGIDHKGDQIQNKVGTLPEDGECDEAKLLEAGELRRLCAAHGFDHLWRHFDRWRERLRVLP